MRNTFKSVLFLFLITCLPAITTGQKLKLKTGKLTLEEVQNANCPYDSSAAAFYMLEYGETRVGADLSIILMHVVRLKIVKSSELDRANITIPYYSRQPITKLKGYTYNVVDGKLEVSDLSKENIFKEKVDDDNSNLKLTFPDVKEGSVIEYTYEARYGNYNRLNTWYFQTSIPVLHSEYHIEIPEYFDYQRMMTGTINLNKADISKEIGRWGNYSVTNNHHHYVVYNAPAFEEEPYSTAKTNNISKIDFELKSLEIPGEVYKTYIPNSYGALANGYMESEYWSKDIDNAPWARDELLTITSDTLDELANAKLIYEHIKGFSKAFEASINLRNAFKNKTGTDSELNRLLIAILRQAGYDVQPVRISTRNHGKIPRYVPMKSNFNFTLARLKIGEEHYFLDASEKEHRFGILPKYCLNGEGLVIQKGPAEWVELAPHPTNGSTTKATMKMDEDGYLLGEITIRRNGYTFFEFEQDMEDEGLDEYKRAFSEKRENWLIETHDYTTLSDYSSQEIINTELEGQVEDLGSVLYLNPMLINKMEDNPFKLEERKQPIDFRIPSTRTYIAEIEIPDGFEVTSLPDPARVGLPGKAGSFLYSVSVMNNKIMVTQRMTISKTEFPVEEYPYLRQFYSIAIEKNGEQIVLKRK